MAIQLSNPLRMLWRYVWGYLRGDDIREADAQTVAAATAARAAALSAPPAPAASVSPPAPTIDRRRM